MCPKKPSCAAGSGWRILGAVWLIVAAMGSGCTQQTLLVVDPYINQVLPGAVPTRAGILTEIRHRQQIDIITPEPNEAITTVISMLLAESSYDAIIATPLYFEEARALARSHPEQTIWQLGGLETSDIDNYHTLTFDRTAALRAVVAYVLDAYGEFDNEFLFLFSPRGAREEAAMNAFEQELLDAQVSFELQRIDRPSESQLSAYSERINSGRYDLVGLFLKGDNYMIYSQLEQDRAAIITEHIGNAFRYDKPLSIVASIEYDYRRGLTRILADTQKQAKTEYTNIILDADLRFYRQ